MTVSSLMDKLMKADAVEIGSNGMPTFSSQFAGYLIWTIGTSQALDTTVGDWHNILAMFNPSLEMLSYDEIADMVLLFEYYLNHPSMPAIEN